ncbi:hypothetical protein RND71_033046 [Anisodus tanguticus]|uniref:Uncharacterized protein n=1 Tax=Anisodus tanguticus TaxID=243964 RepID=A0AAE1R9L0_9SOLA|nr:hypothetical protein RND71_033046 [Anisodus tanguticus]
MATAMFRSSIRSALRGGAPRVTPASKRTFASHSSVHEEAREAAKWEKITYAGIIGCTVLAVINLSKGHPHSDELPLTHTCTFAIRSFHGVQMAFLRSSTTDTAWFLCEGTKIIPVHLRVSS